MTDTAPNTEAIAIASSLREQTRDGVDLDRPSQTVPQPPFPAVFGH